MIATMTELNGTIQTLTLKSSSFEDFYPALIENNVYKVSSWVFSVINILVAPPLLVFIIWFERYGSDQRRTLINMFATMICCTIFIYFPVLHTTELVRFSYGPLPDGLCCIHTLAKSVVLCSLLMFMDAIAVMRYIYIFWLKNLATFRDEFWHCFVTSWIYACSIIIMVVVHFLIECKSMGFLICNGQISDKHNKLLPRVLVIIAVISFALHLLIYLKIQHFKYKGTDHVNVNFRPQKYLYLKDFQTSALTSFSSNILTILVLIGLIGCMHRVGSIPMKDLNIFPNYLCAYYINLLAPCLAADILVATFFRKKGVRRSFHEELLILLEH